MGITIIAGGCRSTDDEGQIQVNQCSTCESQTTCEFEPQARELTTLFSSQWISVDEGHPPEGNLVLYLEYPSETPTGSVHLGYYDKITRRFISQANGNGLLRKQVLAWMPVPAVPLERYARYHPPQRLPSGLRKLR